MMLPLRIFLIWPVPQKMLPTPAIKSEITFTKILKIIKISYYKSSFIKQIKRFRNQFNIKAPP